MPIQPVISSIEQSMQASTTNQIQPPAQPQQAEEAPDEATSTATTGGIKVTINKECKAKSFTKPTAQETMETFVQTDKEARNGNFQAQRKLAKEKAAHPGLSV